jgi:hypothetical protein
MAKYAYLTVSSVFGRFKKADMNAELRRIDVLHLRPWESSV